LGAEGKPSGLPLFGSNVSITSFRHIAHNLIESGIVPVAFQALRRELLEAEPDDLRRRNYLVPVVDLL
jgi:hypothetical protein